MTFPIQSIQHFSTTSQREACAETRPTIPNNLQFYLDLHATMGLKKYIKLTRQ